MKWNAWNNLRTKMIVFMLLPIVVCTVAAITISYSHTTAALRTRAIEENRNLLYQGSRNIDSLLQEVNRISLSVYSDSEFYRLLDARNDDISSNIAIYASLNYIYKAIPDIYQVYLYGVKDNKSTIITQDTPKRWQDPAPYPISAVPENNPLQIQTTHASHHYGLTAPIPQATTEQVFTLHRRIEKIPTSQVLGYLSIDVKLSALFGIVDQLYDRNEEHLFILDSAGNAVYTEDEQLIGKPLLADWYTMQTAGFDSDQGSFEENGSVFIYQRIQSSGADWMLVKQIPVSYLHSEANQAAKINASLFGLALLIIIAAIVLISIRITSPIKRLSLYMNQVQTGNLQVDITPAGNDEIGVLTERFRDMMDTINNLILREYKLELSSKNNQLRALQAQINPHFLNNTLQIIGTLALELKVPQIYTLISSLAKMMRYSMNNDDGNVTLKDELEHVKAYIELQKERFENRFSFHYDIEDSLLQIPMPKMILQPIMENFFKHGINVSGSEGWISLTATKDDEGNMSIIVQNNGAHIPEDKLKRLHNSLSLSGAEQVRPGEDEHAGERHSIGLGNVLTRLRLVYGEEAEMTVANFKPAGVRITLKFKVQDESGMEET
ncbi:two-component system sensor histidine kinase YesM [Fontibacillus phaseoli]|uniref:Two-component system sensor histidine kinase YesM n=1 Tax=Fontibacillus phaseoli TaxID=1416533 RepID=A0A369BGA9_9BACL|nr:sensor histidine kinase [Fontibacillus phaseoli]RCX20589.1 two-component system sensor histidine kinase YesM [Fontibacillus phaseoli]